MKHQNLRRAMLGNLDVMYRTALEVSDMQHGRESETGRFNRDNFTKFKFYVTRLIMLSPDELFEDPEKEA